MTSLDFINFVVGTFFALLVVVLCVVLARVYQILGDIRSISESARAAAAQGKEVAEALGSVASIVNVFRGKKKRRRG